jgi:hypothetical protein
MRKFTAEQVREAVFERDVETIEGENRRWVRSNTSIVKMEDEKFYELHWEEGLTEMQESEFEEQEAHEVEEVEKTIVVQRWDRV